MTVPRMEGVTLGQTGDRLRIDFARIRRDVDELAAMERGSAAADKPQVAWLERRLRDAGAHEIRVEPFAFQRNWVWRHGAHAAAGIGAAALGGAPGAALATATAASYELELSARRQWTARLLPQGEGANVVARVPAAAPAERTIVFLAHHDVQKTGWLWRIGNRLAPAGDAPKPLAESVHAAFALIALGCLLGGRVLRALGGLGLAVFAVAGLDVARNHVVPGANDNATGVASLLALVAALARDPLERTDVVAVFTDCEEVGQGGAAAWVRAHRSELDPARTLVVSLDTLGSGTPAIVGRDGALTAVYRSESKDWADRGALRAAVPPPRRCDLVAPTDAIVAQHAGLRAVSLVSVAADGSLGPHYHLPTDMPANVDWASVDDCTRLAGGIARVWDAVS
jgi:acetylornithine deacetylase/succinyl-diaminopimelate desuccinylase-like protein